MHPHQFKLIALHDRPAPSTLPHGDNPAQISAYYREHIETADSYQPTVENAALIFLSTRRKITGWIQLGNGTLDTLLVHPREIFRAVLLADAAAFVMVHNHPSGDPSPSEADIKITRELIAAAKFLKIELLDHLIFGHPQEGKGYVSLRELGYFYTT